LEYLAGTTFRSSRGDFIKVIKSRMSSSPLGDDKKLNEEHPALRFSGVPIWGIGCGLVLLCAILVAHPYAEVGIADDFSYVRSAQVLAQTGHVVYNGGATAILGWQLYLGALLIKLFGFSFTSTRASIIVVSVIMTFLCQRTFVRAGINEWNASIGALVLMMSPLLMPLEVTFMSDIPGMFAVVVCVYAGLRALQAGSEWATILWIGFASLSNVVLGTSRQIAWLGVLVMVPSAVWILRRNRRVVMAGTGFWLVSVALIYAINHWFQQQPYMLYEPLARGPVTPHVLKKIGLEWLRASLEIVLVLLPILLMYLPALRRKTHPWAVYLLGVGFLVYGLRMWEIHNAGAWFAPYLSGELQFIYLAGSGPFLTIAVLFCVLALITAIVTRKEGRSAAQGDGSSLSTRQLAELLVPFTIASVGLISPRAGFENIWDRYLLPLLFVAIIFFLRFYQSRFQPRLPVAALVLTICVGAYATASLHDRLAVYRARGAAVDEVVAAGIPVTLVSGGWDYDGWTELQHSDSIVDPRMRVPPGVQLPKATHYGLKDCSWFYCTMFPHVVPDYTISFRADTAIGDRFAPVPLRPWIGPPGAVYVVRFPDRSVDGHVP
jgi:hypothetical protein